MGVYCSLSAHKATTGHVERSIEFDDGHWCLTIWDDEACEYFPVLVEGHDTPPQSTKRRVWIETTTVVHWTE